MMSMSFHQIPQALCFRTLIGDVMYKRKEVVYGYIFLHDVCEDKGISYIEEIEKLFSVWL
jgi:hypothetical protein